MALKKGFWLVLICYFFYFAIFWLINDRNILAFVSIGEEYIDREVIEIEVGDALSLGGYDGQFYYQLALNPLRTETVWEGLRIDNTVYRQQRIVYPFLGFMLSFGIQDLVPYTLVFINFLAVLCLYIFGRKLFEELKFKPDYALFLAFYPGVIISFSRSLVEPFALLFLILSLLLLVRKRFYWSTLMLFLAILTKETFLLVAVAAGMVWLFDFFGKRSDLKIKFYYFFVPLLLWLGWQYWLWTIWGTLPALSGGGNLGLPFQGIYESLNDWFKFDGYGDPIYLAVFLWILLFVFYVLKYLRRCKNLQFFRLGFLIYLIFSIFFTSFIWNNYPSFLRVLSELFLFGLILISQQKREPVVLYLLPLVAVAVAATEIFIQWNIVN